MTCVKCAESPELGYCTLHGGRSRREVDWPQNMMLLLYLYRTKCLIALSGPWLCLACDTSVLTVLMYSMAVYQWLCNKCNSARAQRVMSLDEHQTAGGSENIERYANNR